MNDTYYKTLGQSIDYCQKSAIIAGLQDSLRQSCKAVDDNILDFIKGQNIESDGAQKSNSINVDELLKYYLLKQILKEDFVVNSLEEVKNNREIGANVTNTFVQKLRNSGEEIYSIESNGNYITIKQIANSKYRTKRTYNSDAELISIQVVDSTYNLITDMYITAKILGLKKEFVEKYKYAGYSGDSTDIIAAILNKFNAPKASGYYIDNQGHYLKWENSKFVVMSSEEGPSPYLTDYEFKDRIVIRKEYLGRK